ncbi:MULTISPECIES: DUF3426 domain-containing protein [unclassified Moraxella]|uniref:DUF3426 domain-containing protein n=1 Tax=unclassified Moraxella TaxID=2685852 RepID=UPI003AF884FB
MHQTQCPSCQHIFNITNEQLSLKSGFARCNNCHKIFSAVENLIGSPVVPTSPTAHPPVQAPAKDNSFHTDLLFDDDSGLDESGNPINDPTPKVHTFSSSRRGKKNANASADLEIIENFDDLPSKKLPTFTNNKNADSDHDDSWVNELLEAENRNEEVKEVIPNSKLSTISRESNNVSSLLDELGVGVDFEAPAHEDKYLQKVEQRFQNQASSQKGIKTTSIGMTLIWAIGSLLLGLLLVAQYAIFNVNQLVTKPQTLNTLTSVCELSPIDCNLPMADTSLLNIKTLTVTPSKQDSKKTDVIFTLENTAQRQLVYPNLKITLRSATTTQAQLLLSPREYTETDSAYLVGGQIKPVKLRIDFPKSNFEHVDIEPIY